ncbi:MAG: protein-methionine-sulfoxide reductase catalytic subunit MsrP [Pseudomonadota bacterium]|nr:protein-methionine-sulfoxide reductase catalytic subunit MsrP [Pseudomonadota bacterium]
MLFKSKPNWELPESEATPEAMFQDRRRLSKAIAAGPLLLAGASALGRAGSALAADPNPNAGLYPAKRNEAYKMDRALTDEKIVTTYNNFYEFGSHKNIWQVAQKMKLRPWEVTIDGMVEKEITIEADALIKRMQIEERLLRHRCVEAWSIAVPWTGFPLRKLVDMARPLSGAKYLVMQTFHDKKIAPGQRQFWYPWPYVEGLTLAEARNELAFICTGAYGKPMAKQNGAPLRLTAPWKFGFKSIKSITRFTFTDKMPKSFWMEIQGAEYGFWANVNPEVNHPRWSQATEKQLGTGKRVPTLLYNGYAEQVADLYKDMKGENLFM